MTTRAKSLTERASPQARGNFTDQVASARVFLNALERLGYERRALLAAAGVDFSVGDDPDAVIPCQVIGGMFGHVMRTRPLQNLGLRLAMETPIGAFPLLDYLVLTCDMVASA